MKTRLSVGGLEPTAFIVAFPLIGSFIQLLILPFMYDSPDSLAQRKLIFLSSTGDLRIETHSRSENFIGPSPVSLIKVSFFAC